MGAIFPDPFEYARRAIDRAAAAALDRAIRSVQGAIIGTVQRPIRSLAANVEYVTAVLGRLSHGTANLVADSFRGFVFRRLTAGEQALINEAFGRQPVSPTQVCIVPGPGRQPIAVTAFLNGNPAITIGNTIYVKPSVYSERGGADWSRSPDGVELLLHEYTHVVQYARLGFAVLCRRYAREFRKSGGDANRMYDYNSRNLGYADEMLEGQAAIVGDYGRQMALPPEKRKSALINQLRAKLRGTGILGQ